MTDSRVSYTPRVGDKVRATLGETVIVGRVSHLDVDDGFLVSAVIYPSERSFATLELSVPDWDFEQIVSVPSKFGAVIRRADGALFARDNDPRAPWLSLDGSGSGSTDENATAGGFTVLFDGVDE